MNGTQTEELAAHLIQTGNPGEAAKILADALRQGEDASLWNDWATAELNCGHDVRAEWGFRRALRLEPDNRTAAVNLATLLIAEGRLQESVVFLEPHAATLTAYEKGFLTHLTMQPRDCGDAAPPVNHRLLLDAFFALASIIPNDDPEMPGYLRQANRRRFFDTKYYVTECYALLQQLPDEVQTLAAGLLDVASKRDYRFLLVLARHYLDRGEPGSAVPLCRAAIEVKPYDNHVQRMLIEAELAATPEELRPQSKWGGLDEYLKNSFCDKPWRQLELTTDGDVFVCCPGWLPAPIGNAANTPSTELWNSEAVRAIRQSILDGSFSYCGKVHCSFISCRALPSREAASQPLPEVTCSISPLRGDCQEEPAAGPLPEGTLPVMFDEGPREVVLSHDVTCNLACPQCRHEFIYSTQKEQEWLEKATMNFLNGILEGARTLRLLGSGEVLASKSCRELLKRLTREQYPDLGLVLMTNGVLLNRKTFDDLNLWGRIQDISVSIDAAREETYRIVRRGGDFQRLFANLEFLDRLRMQEGKTFRLGFSFVVSSLNFREMPDFVRMCKRFHPGIVGFNFLRNQSNIPADEFKKLDISNADHPDYAEFLKVLEEEDLDDPIVSWGSLGHLRSRRPVAKSRQ